MNRTLLFATLMLGAWIASPARAHFAWLATDSQGRAIYFFGESVGDQTYRLPERLASASVHRHDADGAGATRLELAPVESDSFIGRRSEDPVPATACLTSQQTYGIYQGSRLTYHAQHIAGSPSEWNAKPLADVDFQALLQRQGEMLVVQVRFNGEPLAGAKVQLFSEDGIEHAAATTDDRGQAEFRFEELPSGLNGLLIGHVDKEARGELNGQSYTGDAHYLTVTMRK